MRPRQFCNWLVGSALLITGCGMAQAQPRLVDALAAGRPIIDLRARYENVDDPSKTTNVGEAGTFRARLGYETGVWNGLSMQGDFDQIWLIGGAYNSTRNGQTGYADQLFDTVFIVDDDPMILEALHANLSQAGIKAVKFTSAEQFLANTSRWHSGCVLTDILLPGMSGLELQAELARNNSLISVIVMSGHADIALTVQAMKAGALDVLEKPFNQHRMLELVRSALSVSNKKAARARQDGTASQRLESLTDRQKEILKLIAAGLANKEIAKTLNLSPRTVEVHRARLMKKLRAGNVVELMHNAMISASPLE